MRDEFNYYFKRLRVDMGRPSMICRSARKLTPSPMLRLLRSSFRPTHCSASTSRSYGRPESQENNVEGVVV